MATAMPYSASSSVNWNPTVAVPYEATLPCSPPVPSIADEGQLPNLFA